MSAKRTMTVQIIGDSRNVERMFNRVGSAGSGMKSKLGNVFSSTLSGFKTMAKGLAVGGAALLGGGLFGSFNVAEASADLGEAQSKAVAVLGDGADAVFNFGEQAADAFGMSETAAISAASSFATLLKPSVDSTDQLAEMSTNLTGLSGDLASFNNLASDDVAAKLFAGLSGEAEPLKSLGVFLTAASVEAKALELGLGDSTGAVSEAAKVQARYALILEQTSDAHGDFARTVDGMPNAQRRLGAVWENVRATLGEKLAPAFADVMTRFANVLPGLLDSALPVFEKVAGAIASIVGEVGGAVIAFANSIRSADGDVTSSGLPGWAERFGGILATKVIPFVKSVVGVIVDNWPSISRVAGQVFDVLKTGAMFIADEVLPRLVEAGKFVVGWVVDNWPAISSTISEVFDKVSGIVVGFVNFVSAFWERFGGVIMTTVENAFRVVREVVTTGLDLISGIVGTFTSLLEGDWGGVWDGVKSIVSTALSGLVSIVRAGFGLVWDAIKGVFSSILGGSESTTGGVVSWFAGLPGRILGVLWGAASKLFSVGVDLVQGIWNGASSLWGSFTGWIWDRVNDLTFGISGAIAGALSEGETKVYGKPGFGGAGGYEVAGSTPSSSLSSGSGTDYSSQAGGTVYLQTTSTVDISRAIQAATGGGYGFGGIAPGLAGVR